MKRLTGMVTAICLAALLFAWGAMRFVTSAEASVATVFFSGSGFLNGPGPHTGAVLFGGSFVFDTSWADSDPDPRVGIYNRPAPPPAFSFGLTWIYLDNNTFDPGIGFNTWNITIRDPPTGGPGVDVFYVRGDISGLVNAQAEVFLLDLANASGDNTSILTNDHLFVPSFAQFFDQGFASVNRLACLAPATCAEAHWFGRIGRFEVVVDDPAVIPLPGAIPLFATGLGVLGLLAWRGKRKGAAALAA